MKLNLVRGFRRLAWVVSVFIGLLSMLVLEREAEYVAGYNVRGWTAEFLEPSGDFVVSKVGKIYYPSELSESSAIQMVEKKWTSPGSIFARNSKEGLPIFKIDQRRETNYYKLALIGLACFGIVAAILQGSISLIAWIGRGFAGNN